MDWFVTSYWAILAIVLSALGIYVALILFTRLGGLRSFSKMSGFDFAITVSLGSVIASVVVTKDPPLVQGVAALAALFSLQLTLAALRQRWAWLEDWSSNKPRLIMIGDQIQHDQLRKAKISEADLRAKLREANVLNYGQIKAVVAETTGDISVLHIEKDDCEFDPQLLKGVIGIERLTSSK